MKKNPMKTNPVTRLTVRRAQRRGDSAMMAIGDVLHQWQGEAPPADAGERLAYAADQLRAAADLLDVLGGLGALGF